MNNQMDKALADFAQTQEADNLLDASEALSQLESNHSFQRLIEYFSINRTQYYLGMLAMPNPQREEGIARLTGLQSFLGELAAIKQMAEQVKAIRSQNEKKSK